MNPLVQGLFNKFRETEELLKLSDADAFELFATSLILPDDLLGGFNRSWRHNASRSALRRPRPAFAS